MSDISENEVIEENFEEVPLTKQKKPSSQAQVEAFEKVKEKRRQNLESKKQEKLLKSAKLLIEEENKKQNSACGRCGVIEERGAPLMKHNSKKKSETC